MIGRLLCWLGYHDVRPRVLFGRGRILQVHDCARPHCRYVPR